MCDTLKVVTVCLDKFQGYMITPMVTGVTCDIPALESTSSFGYG